jgi:hypothetical protein
MAHFAQLDDNNVVLQVIVVHNNDCLDANGNESEAVGIAFCQSLFPATRWQQTSYNGNMRGMYAGIGYTYDAVNDVFVPPFDPTLEIVTPAVEVVELTAALASAAATIEIPSTTGAPV